jgi:uncharacterized protein (DUF302 family)
LFVAKQPRCVVAMEACASAHHWGREIGALGHQVRLIPPAYVKPFVKRQATRSSQMTCPLPGATSLRPSFSCLQPMSRPPIVAEEHAGIIDVPSSHSVDQTVDRLKNILQSKGVPLFAVIDHSGEAAKVGLQMPPTKLLIFGNPRAGTPVMLSAPSIAIDLPLKILVHEDGNGRVWLSYNSPEYLKQRHGVPDALIGNIAVAGALAAKAGEAAD